MPYVINWVQEKRLKSQQHDHGRDEHLAGGDAEVNKPTRIQS